MKNIQIVEYNPFEPVKRRLHFSKFDKGSLAVRLSIVESKMAKLHYLLNLNSQICTFSSDGITTPLTTSFSKISNNLRFSLKEYLEWINNQLKLFQLIDLVEFNIKSIQSNSIKFQRLLISVQNNIRSFLFLDSNLALSPSNRSGRLCERVEADISMFNISTILEQGMENYDSFILAQSSIFSRQEVTILLGADKPTFTSGVFVVFFSDFFKTEHCPISTNLSNAIYQTTVSLFYEVYNNPNYTHLRALVFFLTPAIARCDYKVVEKIFMAIIKIWQILNLDIVVSKFLLVGSTDNDSLYDKSIIQIWYHIWSLFFSNSHVFPLAGKHFAISNLKFSLLIERTQFNKLSTYHFKQSLSPNDRFFVLINCMNQNMKQHTIHSYVETSLSLKDKLISSEVNNPLNIKYKVNQELINSFHQYTKHIFNSKLNIDTRDHYNLNHFLILIPQPSHHFFSTIHSLKLTVTVYTFQIALICPSIIILPTPAKLKARELCTLLNTSLSFYSIMTILINACFKKQLYLLNLKGSEDSLLAIRLTKYLEEDIDPIIDDGLKEKCFLTMKCLQFVHFLTITYTFLTIISSSIFPYLLLFHPTISKIIQSKVHNIIQILKIVQMFDKQEERMDIEKVITSLRINVPKFNVPIEFAIDWSDLF